jgi:hypothetical protein
VRAFDRVCGVTEDARDAAQVLRELREVRAVLRLAGPERDGRVAADAEVLVRSVRLADHPLVHREEHGIIGGVGVHAAGPFVDVRAVTRPAALGIEERLAGKRRLGLGRRLRLGAARCPERAGGEHRRKGDMEA